ncbi:GNAT family N-acetyltransferase [Streptomyces ortus]|jgi:RimJ/RimL family protein N-acetyltransferase|uniref:GNAT family N-acetyltransferase n=1 Tax=Streptomyces ortus TaxID=2867268 RepID=A0ABT3V733_9ACTN|nr:GNAT family protein [Streptomyces ortus]MCX4234181.1 GNAT family N-acetyltransferase [Streptomyces ortus]
MSDDAHAQPAPTTARVRLRPVRDTDLPAFFAYEQDPEATRRSRFPARSRERFMTHWRTRILGDPTVRARTVDVDDAPAGNIVAWWEADEATREDRRFTGYWLGRPYWGRGIGTEALGLFLREEGVRPLYADPFPGNTASVRLLERHGFRPAGTVRHGDDVHTLLVLDAAPAPAPG